MLFADAVVERSRETCDGIPLLEACPRATTVSEFVRATHGDPALQRAYPGAAAVLLELLELDAAGAVRLVPNPVGASLRQFYETGRANGDLSLNYVATYEGNWRAHRSLYDFVEAGDANGARKAFQRDVYVRHLRPYLDSLRPGARVLDAGCGVGRLTGELLARGLSVTCLDASTQALKCAARVALRSGGAPEAVDAVLCDVREMTCFEDASFEATLALELICYQDDPAVSLREIRRVTAPGGLVALSVEGVHGSAVADPKLGSAESAEVLDRASVDIDNHLSVRYFTKNGLRSLVESVALESVEVVGTQYTVDGIFDRLATDAAFADADEIRRLAALERAAAADPLLEPLARAWLATARVPEVSR